MKKVNSSEHSLLLFPYDLAGLSLSKSCPTHDASCDALPMMLCLWCPISHVLPVMPCLWCPACHALIIRNIFFRNQISTVLKLSLMSALIFQSQLHKYHYMINLLWTVNVIFDYHHTIVTFKFCFMCLVVGTQLLNTDVFTHKSVCE